MVRFLHTSDWHLGKTRLSLKDEAQARYAQARIDAIRRIGTIAVEEKCEFVVVCGDVFESNLVGRDVVIRALDAMADTPGITFFLLPGNHDPLDPSSVYCSRTFAGHRPENVVVLEEANRREAAPGVELIPAPWLSKRPLADLVNQACDDLEPTDGVRIVVGHGRLDSMSLSGHDPTLIALSTLEERLESGLIHYVALGDRHSKTDTSLTGMIWYSGTPEPTRFDEIDPGKVLVVSLDRSQAFVEDRSAGAWQFLSENWELTGDADLDALDEWLSDLREKECTIVRLSLTGQVSLAQKARLDMILEEHSDPLAALDVAEGGALVVIPDHFDINDLGLSGFASKAFEDLHDLAQTGEQTETAREALTLLYRLVMEAR